MHSNESVVLCDGRCHLESVLAEPPPWRECLPSCYARIGTSIRSGIESSCAIVYWSEHTYNRRRRQRALGKLTPVEFELAFTSRIDQAA